MGYQFFIYTVYEKIKIKWHGSRDNTDGTVEPPVSGQYQDQKKCPLKNVVFVCCWKHDLVSTYEISERSLTSIKCQLTPDNSNLDVFQFPLKVWLSGVNSLLYVVRE